MARTRLELQEYLIVSYIALVDSTARRPETSLRRASVLGAVSQQV